MSHVVRTISCVRCHTSFMLPADVGDQESAAIGQPDDWLCPSCRAGLQPASASTDSLPTSQHEILALLEMEHQERLDAEHAAHRLRQLQAMTDVALAHLDFDELIRQLLVHIKILLDAQSVSILLLNEIDGSLRAHSCVDAVPGSLRFSERLVPAMSSFTRRMVAEARPVLLSDGVEPSIVSELDTIGTPRSLVAVPLRDETRILGAVIASSEEAGNFTFDDQTFLVSAADRVVLAIERSRAYEVERDARSVAEQARGRLAFLAGASTLMTSTLDYDATLNQVSRLLVPFLADICDIWMVTDDGSIHQAVVTAANPADVDILHELERLHPLQGRPGSVVRKAILDSQTQLYQDVTEDALDKSVASQQQLEMLKRLGLRSFMAVPLITSGRTLGAITLASTRSGRRYTPADLEFAEDLARRAALAVDNARLFDEIKQAAEAREQALAREQAARAEAEAAQRRLVFLTVASNVLASSLDFETTLQSVTHIAVPHLADWCSINLIDEDGVVNRAGVAHINAEKEAILEEIRRRYPARRIDSEHPLGQVIQTAKTALYPTVDDDLVRRITQDDEHYHLSKQLETASMMVSPLVVHGRTLGAITFGASEGRRFTEEDVALADDLSYRAALAVDNAQLYLQAQQIVKVREEFISIASHELKTPLTTIKGYLQLLERQVRRPDHRPERLANLTTELGRQVYRLEELVADLLDVSRIQQGRVELRPESLDLSEMARELINRFEHAQERGPGHRLRIHAPEPVVGVWDPARLDQVLTNLLSNALKYSPDGGEIFVSVTRQDDQAEVIVRDQGIGISAQDLKQLFEPFARGDAVRGSVSGTGLGLYISRRIIEHHRGTISAQSRPGHGTTFIIRLPLD